MLAETCSLFCMINKLCLDLIYVISDFADSTTDVNCQKIPPLYQSAIPCLYTYSHSQMQYTVILYYYYFIVIIIIIISQSCNLSEDIQQ